LGLAAGGADGETLQGGRGERDDRDQRVFQRVRSSDL
jgi:hypothetical protein